MYNQYMFSKESTMSIKLPVQMVTRTMRFHFPQIYQHWKREIQTGVFWDILDL